MSNIKPAVPSTPVRTANMCVFMTCVQLWYTIQHWTVLITLPPILQTITTAWMTSVGGEGTHRKRERETDREN